MDRKAQANLHRRRSSIVSRASSTQAVEFFNLLTSPELLQTTESLLPKHRERLYPPTVTLSIFMHQVLEADGSCQKALRQWLWRGRAVKLVDGTGLSMPDTPENQAGYPQPSTQAAGVGFPLARLVMVICLATGAALNTAIGPHQGKGRARAWWRALRANGQGQRAGGAAWAGPAGRFRRQRQP